MLQLFLAERDCVNTMTASENYPSKRTLYPAFDTRQSHKGDKGFLLSDKITPGYGVGDSRLKFSDVVDDDIGQLKEKLSLHLLGRLLESSAFKCVMFVFILLNCIVIGLQTDKFLESTMGTVLHGIDHFCLTVFILEILLKWYHDFLAFWKNGWNILDFIIVVAAILGPSLAFMGSSSRILRSLRVFRSLRSLRSISVLGGLQVIVQTVIFSFSDMANIVALLVIIMFVFAVLGVSVFGETCPNNFGSLGSAMFALFVCVTQDGWMDINQELKDGGFIIVGSIYLVIFITIGAFVFANLVVADVLANLELAISEQNRLKAKKLSDNKDGDNPEVIDSAPLLQSLRYKQQPLETPDFNLNTNALETFFTVLSALEANLQEFKNLKENISEIASDVKSLASVDNLSDDDVFEFSTMATDHHGDSISQSSVRMRSQPSKMLSVPSRRHSLATDALTGLILLSHNRKVDTTQVNNLQQLMQLLKSKSTHSVHSHGSARLLLSSSSDLGGRGHPHAAT